MRREPATLAERLYRVMHRLRLLWREHVTRRWRYFRTPVLLALAISVLVLGTIGFQQWSAAQAQDQDFSVFDSLYRAITLFAFAGAVSPPVPTALQIARILGPVLTGYAAIGTILVLTREQAQLLVIRLFLRRHVIIAGLGYTGSRLALELIRQQPVVAIEADPTNERVRAVRERGVPVLLGDATDPLLLRQAGLRSCRQLVASCGNDGASIDVATAAASNLGRRQVPPTTCVHLNDLKLWQSLAAESITFASHKHWRLEYSNVLVLAAELMLDRDQPFGVPSDPTTAPSEAHLLFVGLEGPGEQLVLKAARLWSSIHPGGGDRLRITVTGGNAEAEAASLRERYPQIKRYCRLRARQLQISSAEFQSGSAMFEDDGCDVTHAYVCLLDEGDGMLAALSLHSRSEALHVPVTVIVSDEHTGVGDAVNKADSRGANVRSFGVLSETASDALLLRGINELIARSKHEQWLRDELKEHPESKSSFLRSWEELTESQREDNRRFADDVVNKIESVDCILVPHPLPNPDEPRFTFTEEELEKLAIDEHDRWVQARLAAGWRPTRCRDESRDDNRKLHPDLVPWEELISDYIRDKDRNAILELPEILERAGLKVQRRTSVPAGTSAPSDAAASPLAPSDRAVDDLGPEVPAAHARERL